jgi:hypothetical protein
MKAIRDPIRFDHGAALRVPPAHDVKGRNALWRWLGENGYPAGDGRDVQVNTRHGAEVARPGDWIVLSVSGDFHVARSIAGWTN